MQKVLAWERQRIADGDISKRTRRAMSALADGHQTTVASVSVSSGSQLVREWIGRRYQVDVTDLGYVLDGRTFASLTAVAKHITGTNWSGPRFFGLNIGKGLA